MPLPYGTSLHQQAILSRFCSMNSDPALNICSTSFCRYSSTLSNRAVTFGSVNLSVPYATGLRRTTLVSFLGGLPVFLNVAGSPPCSEPDSSPARSSASASNMAAGGSSTCASAIVCAAIAANLTAASISGFWEHRSFISAAVIGG